MTRLSYPAVAAQQHPLADGSRVLAGCARGACAPDGDDLRYAEEIIDLHHRLQGRTVADGAWEWINTNWRAGYIDSIVSRDVPRLARYLATLFRNETSAGLVSYSFAALQKEGAARELENRIMLDLDTWREFTDQDDDALPYLDSPRVGSPFGLRIGDILISIDSPRHDYFACKINHLAHISSLPRPRILEIGGGYGGLCLQLLRRLHNVCYINCDLPETLYIAYYFLRKGVNAPIHWVLSDAAIEGYPETGLLFVPAQFAGNVRCQVDIAFNTNSLSEMERPSVEAYMALLHRLRPTWFMHSNSNFLLFPSSEMHVEVLASEFPIDRALYCELSRAIAPWQGASGRCREFVYKLSS
jgi:hypothetical protein